MRKEVLRRFALSNSLPSNKIRRLVFQDAHMGRDPRQDYVPRGRPTSTCSSVLGQDSCNLYQFCWKNDIDCAAGVRINTVTF